MKTDTTSLRILVIGLGSMGKRRIRNLMKNGVTSICGFDAREDRRVKAKSLYPINVFPDLDSALNQSKFDAFIISVPPDVHHIYIKKALQLNIPAFIEASVVDTDMELLIKEANAKRVFLAPSCTLFFHPAITTIADIVSSGKIGNVTNILYHSGQYLPDWHSYEKVSEYYVSKKETGGAREIVPFELTWLTLLLGFPKRIAGFYKKTIHIEGAESIEDTYNLLLDYAGFILNLTVDVVSRVATRRLVINGEHAQLYWDWSEGFIKLFDAQMQAWQEIPYEVAEAHSGYNKNITETMYNNEIAAFLDGIQDKSAYPNSMEKDLAVLKLLYSAEKSCDTNVIQTVK